MASERRGQPAYEDMTDDALVDRGAELETRRATIAAEFALLLPNVETAGRILRKSAIKLGVNTALGIGGIVAAPLTLGWSLIITAGSGFMLVWDGLDFGRDYSRHNPHRHRLRQLRAEASAVADELAAIHAILDMRSRGPGPPSSRG